MKARLWFLSACFLAAAALNVRAMRPELVPPRVPLAALPTQLGDWKGQDDPPLSSEVLSVLGADEYLSRTYARAGDLPLLLYVGFYQSQREGDTIHSPLNCLPGAGWQPIVTTRRQIDVPGRNAPIEVNLVVIRKGLEQGVVLYWYQSQGRVVASEYWSKLFMIYDSARTHRSDGALLRVITPLAPTEAGDTAEERAVGFVKSLFSEIERHLPS